MKTLDKNAQANITPDIAIDLLKSGNKRFLDNLRYNRNLLQQVNETADGQFPFATILSCIDSRTPAEIIFDQGLGDIFSIRIAGNVINDDILGSMEFACKVAGSKLLVVLGHTNCGAVKGACDNVHLEHLTGLLSKIEPSVKNEKSIKADRNGGNLDFVNNVATLNVHHSLQIIRDKSDLIKGMIEDQQIKMIGGIYNVSNGAVDFFE